MQKVRLGIVGAGRLGGFHASKAAVNPEVDFVGIADVCEKNRRSVASKYGVKDFASIDELLPCVDAVVIASPSFLHAELGEKALGAGKHLLVEKPATTSGVTARKLANLAKSNGLVMQVGHVEQYNPAWREAIRRLSNVKLGNEPAIVEAERTSGYTFRSTDVGATLDLMIHDLELTLSLIPSPILSVSAFTIAQLGGHEDATFATIDFENGSVARLKASRIEQVPQRRMTIQTANEQLSINFAARSLTSTRPSDAVLQGRYAPDKVTYFDMESRVSTFMKEEYESKEIAGEPIDALELEMRDFVSAILRKTPSTVPGERAARAVEVAEMIIENANARIKRFDSKRYLKVA